METWLAKVVRWISSGPWWNSHLQSAWLPLLLIGLFILGLFFRWNGLGKKIYSLDETYTSFRAAGYTESEAIRGLWGGHEVTTEDIQKYLRPSTDKNVFDTIYGLALEEPQNSPLYFVLAHFWMREFGNSRAAMRSLSALISLFAVVGIYWLSLELFQSPVTALLSVVFMGLSPFHILFAQEARPYALFTSATVLSSAALLRAIRQNTKFTWATYGASIVVGLYSHQLFALVAIAHGIYLVTTQKIHAGTGVRSYFVATCLAFLAFVPWVIILIANFEEIHKGLGWIDTRVTIFQRIASWVIVFASPFIDIYLGPRNVVSYLLRIPVLFIMGYALGFLCVRCPRHVQMFVLMLIGVTAGALMALDVILGGIRSIRGAYLVACNTGTLMAVAHFLALKLQSPKRSGRKKWEFVTSLLIVGTIVSGINSMRAETWWNKAPLNSNDLQAVRAINQAAHPLVFEIGSYPKLGDVLALSYMLERNVRFKLGAKPENIEILGEPTDVFVFNPSDTDIEKLRRTMGYEVELVAPGSLWRIARLSRPLF